MPDMVFSEELKKQTSLANAMVLKYLPKEEGFQKKVIEASNYSVINGGKRLRPVMMCQAYLLLSGKKALSENDGACIGPFMAAMEMIHSSSLVHDDLPCMDNDVLRRGKPSTWAKYGEAFGTLAGDALMIYAFETAAKSEAPAEAKLRAIRLLAEKTGIYGMIGGQTLDVELTGKEPAREQLEFIYRLKTGALIEASLMIGGALAGAGEEELKVLSNAGSCLGMAFQIEDDILDALGTEEELGKPVGSDEKLGKVTWLTYYGREQALSDVREYTKKAVDGIRKLGGSPFLEELFRRLAGRKS